MLRLETVSAFFLLTLIHTIFGHFLNLQKKICPADAGQKIYLTIYFLKLVAAEAQVSRC